MCTMSVDFLCVLLGDLITSRMLNNIPAKHDRQGSAYLDCTLAVTSVSSLFRYLVRRALFRNQETTELWSIVFLSRGVAARPSRAVCSAPVGGSQCVTALPECLCHPVFCQSLADMGQASWQLRVGSESLCGFAP